jgi:hypothetical protein
MKRRAFLEGAAYGSMAEVLLAGSSARAQQPSNEAMFRYGAPLTISELRTLESGAGGTGGLFTVPQRAQVVVPIFFSETDGKFIKSREVKATLDKTKKYSLAATLRGAQITADQTKSLADSNLQLNFNVGVPRPNNPGDIVNWLAMSGIDVFGETTNRQTKLIAFQKGASLTGAFPTGQGIEVSGGKLQMSVELFGQKKQSWWERVLKIGGAIAGTPVFGQLGLPMLAKQVLDFTVSALSKVQENDKLVGLLQTPPVPYTIAPGDAPLDRYKLCDGLWVAVDLDTAERTNYLAEYEVDLNSMTFPVRKKATKDILETNYMTFELTFTAVS